MTEKKWLHNCQWSGCKKQIHFTRWGCVDHYSRLPISLREEVKKFFNVDHNGEIIESASYTNILKVINQWIKNNERE